MSLRVETIESLEALEAIEPEWRDLWRQDPCAGPFQGPDWLLPWTRRLWGGGKLRVFAVWNGGDLVALAPLFLWGFEGRPSIVRASFLGAGVSDQLGVQVAAARLVLERLAATAAQWHVCELEELSPGSALLRAEPPPGLTTTQAPCSVCPVLALPRSMEELLGRLAPKFRKNLRQSDGRLRRMGAEFFTATPAEAPEVMDALFRLHAARWSLRREPGMLRGEALQRFHREAAERLAHYGILRLNAIRAGGSIIAVQYNVWKDRRLCYYLSGFDPEFARYSPGAALLAWSIRSAIEEGAVEIDFLRHREHYKYEWGARDRVNRKLLVLHSAVYARDVA
jgi:CelD/BcsL family acetyltransferase involved in cellulose biosynthesis